MRRRALASSLSLFLALQAFTVLAAGDPAALDLQKGISGHTSIHYGGAVSNGKAAADSIYVMGGPGRLDGKFQDATRTIPDSQGWTSIDRTLQSIVRWHLDTFNAALLDNTHVPNHAMWCGALFSACSPSDPAEGYGNNWDELLDWRGVVPNATQPTTVSVTARVNYDCEQDYDYLRFEVERATGMSVIQSFTGANKHGNPAVFTPIDFNQSFSVTPPDYVGPAHNQVHLRWHATSDGGYSDEDCNWAGSGHSQVDNITVKFNNVTQTFDDFETGSPVHWQVAFPPSVGDFSKVWPRLADIDPCGNNSTPVFAFIDDGVVVPGTGGTIGTTWTYGPSGYVVNLLGGLAGPDFHLYNEIWSPALDWPAGYDGGALAFDVYRHVPLDNGLFWMWNVRSSADGGTTWTDWRGNNLVEYSDVPEWFRAPYIITDLLTPGRNKVQVALACIEYGWVFGFNGTDGTPAPYFDNVSVQAYRFTGPGMTLRDLDSFNDGFPAIGVIDYTNLANNSVRVDIARNISPAAHLRNDPGDSMYANIAAVRPGSVLNGRPQLHVRLYANPLFDPYRRPLASLPGTWTRNGRILEGTVIGDTTYTRPTNSVVRNRWNWDLPDTGFFYPGDVFHYYLRAQDNLAGDIGTSLLPADTTGYSFFPGMAGYTSLRLDSDFWVQALPSMSSATAGNQPHILFWNDFGNRGGENEWIGSLDKLGYRRGADYDIYYTHAPSSGLGNGLGGRASSPQLAGYTTMLYSAGDLSSVTLSNGDYALDAGNDIGVLDTWLGSGGKDVLFAGDSLEEDLNGSGTAAIAFRNKWLSVTHGAGDIRPFIANQTAPHVRTVAGNPLGLNMTWVADGGCFQGLNQFDAVTATGAAVRFAEFLNPAGQGGVYPYAAGVYNNVAANTARVVYLPYDLIYVANPTGKAPASLSARAQLLRSLLLFFGEAPTGTATDVPQAGIFAVRSFPNPFNPSTKIEFNLPRAARIELKVYNVRGELVQTLLDRYLEAGAGSVTWNGTDAAGRSVASGVYFYSLKAGDLQKIEKMTLVK